MAVVSVTHVLRNDDISGGTMETQVIPTTRGGVSSSTRRRRQQQQQEQQRGSVTRTAREGDADRFLRELEEGQDGRQEIICNDIFGTERAPLELGRLLQILLRQKERISVRFPIQKLALSNNQLGPSCAPALASIIQATAQTLRELDISKNAIRSDGLSTMIETFTMSSCRLTSLNLSSNNIGAKGRTAIASLLRYTTSIRSLDLSHNDLRSKGIRTISSALRNNKTLTQLNISQNKLRDPGVKHIAKLLDPVFHPHTALSVLDLSHNKIGPKGAYKLASALLEGNRTLRYLNLSMNAIETDGANYLGAVLQFSHTLQELNLSRNNISCIEGLVHGLIENHNETNLRVLDISWNLLKDDSAMHIADLLKVNSTLEQLDVGNNGIGDIGFKAMANALTSDLALKKLSIVGNQLDCLESVLQFSNTLEEVNLSHNNIACIDGIIRGLEQHESESNLRILDVSCNLLQDDAAKRLANLLHVNKTLEQLDLGDNRIGDAGFEAIADALVSGSALKNLNMIGNQVKDPTPLIHVLCHGSCQLQFEHNPLPNDAADKMKSVSIFHSNKATWLGKHLANIAGEKQVKLDLSSRCRTHYGDEEVIAISNQLCKYRPRVTTASFGGPNTQHRVSHRGIDHFARHVLLAPNPGEVTGLYLENVNLRGKVEVLALAISRNKKLRRLRLSSCCLDASDAAVLAMGIKESTSIERLGLDGNELGDRGCRSLIQSLSDKGNASFSLDLSRNGLTDAGLSNLSKIVMLELKLCHNPITDMSALGIAQAVLGTTNLRYLSILGTQITWKGIKTLELFLPQPHELYHHH